MRTTAHPVLKATGTCDRRPHRIAPSERDGPGGQLTRYPRRPNALLGQSRHAGPLRAFRVPHARPRPRYSKCAAIAFMPTDPQTGVAPGLTRGRHVRSRCRCSMCSAIHINSRSWLRSSSTHEPSDPPLKVVLVFAFVTKQQKIKHKGK